MRYRGNGGLLGPNLSSNTSYAPGIWSIPDFQQRLGAGTWPTDLTAALLADPNFEYNTFLMKAVGANTAQNYTFLDSSAGNYSITRNGDVTQGAFSPHAYADGYWSAYFDGTGDTLTLSSSTNNQFGSGDFTIETWYFCSGSISTSGQQLFFRRTTTAAIGLIFQIDSSKLNLLVGDSTIQAGWDVNISSTTTLVAGTWYHLAMSRSGSTWRIFINGVQEGSATASFTIAEESGNITIGSSITGYLSNWRAVKGTAVYTSAFTPSTTPLTAISGTSILTCQSNRFIDKSSNAFTITRNGDSKITTFGPFNPSIYSASTTGGSFYFDGTGDFNTASYSTSDFDWWTNDYTAEAWIYPTTLTGWHYFDGTRYIPTLMGNMNSASGTNYWSFGPINDSTVRLYYYNGSGQSITSTQTITLGQWNHIAFTKTSSGVTIFVNGVASTTSAVSGTPQSSSGTALTIGSYAATAINGYASDIRIVKGTAVYSGNFTPPTSPLTAISNTKYLLSGTNAGIIDASRKSNLYTVGNAQVRTNVVKYDKSVYFDGTGDYVRALSSDFTSNIGTSDFTMECWVYKVGGTVVASNSDGGADNNYFLFEVNSGNTAFQIRDASSQAYAYGSAITTNTWTHVAVTRSSGTVTVYVNGTAGTPVSITKSITNRSTLIGAFLYTGFDSYFNGYIEDFRITRGLARYTTNFTPPTTLQTS